MSMQGSNAEGGNRDLAAVASTRAGPADFDGRRILFWGKLAGMPHREARPLVLEQGALVVESLDAEPDLVVIGDSGVLSDDADRLDRLVAVAENRDVEIISETDLWQRLGLLETQTSVQRLYTPAMLADLLGVEVSVVRRWHRRALIQPVEEVGRLPYFDFAEVTTARQLAALICSGVSAASLERQLSALARWLPNVDRPLAQLNAIVEGRNVLLRDGAGLVDAKGQRRIDFDRPLTQQTSTDPPPTSPPTESPNQNADGPALSAGELLDLAEQLEDDGQLQAAAETYRTAMAAGGPEPWTCFLLAELLYRMGDIAAARERYYMAIELDEHFVEARANLGCVLAETGERELAVAALEGALTFHPDFPDGHYHLARTLEELGRPNDAAPHWERFLELAPNSPWADVARQRVRPN